MSVPTSSSELPSFETVFAPVSTVMRLANESSLTRVMLDLVPRSDQKRVIEQVKALLAARYASVEADRVYPDDIESAYGTKQWYFTARR